MAGFLALLCQYAVAAQLLLDMSLPEALRFSSVPALLTAAALNWTFRHTLSEQIRLAKEQGEKHLWLKGLRFPFGLPKE